MSDSSNREVFHAGCKARNGHDRAEAASGLPRAGATSVRDTAPVLSRGGSTWSEPVTLLREAGWGFSAQHGPTQLADGSVLAPAMSIRKSQVWPRGEYRVYALRSHDEGRSWDVRQIGPMPGWRWQNQYGRVMDIDGAALLSDPRCPAGSPWPARVTVDDFKTLRELYREVEPTVAALDLTAEGVRYYANSVVKS